MAIHVLKDQKLWFGGYDVTGKANALGLDCGAEAVDDTVFGDTTRSRTGGLKTVAAQVEGFFDAAALGSVLYDNIGVKDVPMSFGAQGGAENDVAYTFLANLGQLQLGDEIGGMFDFSVGAEGSGDLIRATLMHNAARTATANGTARQLGAVSATEKLYAALHVVAASGTTPTLDVTVESDDASGFASPTTRITFAQKTAIGSEWATPVAGSITDDWWRITWTITGTGPSFTFAVVVGIQ